MGKKELEDDELYDDQDDGEMEVVYTGLEWQEEPGDEQEEERVYAVRPNKTAIKREIAQVRKIVERLLEFSEERLLPLGLSEKTTMAMAEGRRLKKPDAIRRHISYLSKLFLNEDLDAATAFIESIDAKHGTNTRHFHRLEQ